ncbi:MAG: LysM peptidoglycan-binding domain-containing protein [Cocleimonas sp.]|nr:LysM peptidoglycan-binding domain-containing protein [Cocleimonas sp.]
MNKSIFTTSFIVLAVSAFSAYAQAEEVKRPNLSITPISEAQADSMHSHPISHGSSISTTVTIGGRTTQSVQPVTHLKVNTKNQQGKKANIVIQHIIAEHQVKNGDTLSKIAGKYGTTIEHIMQINKLKSTKILVGQTLKV